MNKAPEKRKNMFSANAKWSRFFGIWQTHGGAYWDLRETEEEIVEYHNYKYLSRK